MGLTHYQVLGVNEQAGSALLKRQYYALSKKYHPDSGSGDERHMTAINEAYRVLSSPLLRSAYDRQLREARKKAEESAYRPAPSEPKPQYATPPRANAHTYIYEQPPRKKHSWFAWFMFMGTATAALLIVGSYLLPVKETTATATPTPPQPTTSNITIPTTYTDPTLGSNDTNSSSSTNSSTPPATDQSQPSATTPTPTDTTTTPTTTQPTQTTPQHRRHIWPWLVYNSTND